jgi:intracellular sulfur oxidation DsrE/DsrF family protein
MKKLTLLIIIFNISFTANSQVKTVKGQEIKDFGKFYKIKKPDLLLDRNKIYKVIFDVYTDEEDDTKINANINTVARFINMRVQQGIKPDKLKIVLVLHGKATKNALSDSAFKKRFHFSNPNYELLEDLKKSGVKTYVCGQSFAYKGFERKELSKHVELSLSALTALVYYQNNGYALISFN